VQSETLPRASSRRPDGVELRQGLVEQDGHRGIVTERRDTADRPPDPIFDLLGVGHRHRRFRDVKVSGKFRFTHTICAAGHDHYQIVVDRHDDTAGDLSDFAADRIGRVGSRLRSFWELVDVDLKSILFANSIDEALGARVHSRAVVIPEENLTGTFARMPNLEDNTAGDQELTNVLKEELIPAWYKSGWNAVERVFRELK